MWVNITFVSIQKIRAAIIGFCFAVVYDCGLLSDKALALYLSKSPRITRIRKILSMRMSLSFFRCNSPASVLNFSSFSSKVLKLCRKNVSRVSFTRFLVIGLTLLLEISARKYLKNSDKHLCARHILTFRCASCTSGGLPATCHLPSQAHRSSSIPYFLTSSFFVIEYVQVAYLHCQNLENFAICFCH